MILEEMKTCLEQADAVIITTPDPKFKALRAADFPKKDQPILVYDCWRILLGKLETANHIRYIPLGIGMDKEISEARLKKMWSDPEEV